MAQPNQVFQGQSVETLEDALQTWKMIQVSTDNDSFNQEEANDMVKFLTNELAIMESQEEMELAITNETKNVMNNSSIVLVLASIECQLSDWSVTTTEDGYSQEYINGRVDGLASAINTLKALIEKE